MNNLKELRINQEGILPSFDKDIYEYYLTISEDVNDLEIEAIPENLNSRVEISGNTNLQNGENLITVKVISDDEEDTIYNIQVIKTNNVQLSNNNLEILSVENVELEPAFDKNITSYNLEVPNNVVNLNILAIPENENAKIEVKRYL